MTLSPISFDVVLFLLLSLVTGPSSMSISSLVLELIFFYKRLTRILEIGNTTVWVLPNIRRLGWVRDTKFGRNVSNEMLLNAAECQGYSFYRFWVIKEKPTGGVKLPHTQIRVKDVLNRMILKKTWVRRFKKTFSTRWSLARRLEDV